MTQPLLFDFPKTFTAETHPELSLAARRVGTRLIMLAEVAGLKVLGTRVVDCTAEGRRLACPILEVDVDVPRGTAYLAARHTQNGAGPWLFSIGGVDGYAAADAALFNVAGAYLGHAGADAAHAFDTCNADWTTLAHYAGMPKYAELRRALITAWDKARETAQAA